ncbi:MAG: MarR family transcriptional regulator [Clostridium sp.]|nr:MarR family transcriptional regulator [Clostridium sp.]
MANQAVLHKKLLSNLKNTCLTLGQPKILDYLKDHDGASQKEIAAACYIEAASLTSILNRMEEKGMIERRMLNGNRRSFYIFMTPFGKELQEEVANSFSMLEEEAFRNIPKEKKEELIDLLLTIHNNLIAERKANDID